MTTNIFFSDIISHILQFLPLINDKFSLCAVSQEVRQMMSWYRRAAWSIGDVCLTTLDILIMQKLVLCRTFDHESIALTVAQAPTTRLAVLVAATQYGIFIEKPKQKMGIRHLRICNNSNDINLVMGPFSRRNWIITVDNGDIKKYCLQFAEANIALQVIARKTIDTFDTAIAAANVIMNHTIANELYKIGKLEKKCVIVDTTNTARAMYEIIGPREKYERVIRIASENILPTFKFTQYYGYSEPPKIEVRRLLIGRGTQFNLSRLGGRTLILQRQGNPLINYNGVPPISRNEFNTEFLSNSITAGKENAYILQQNLTNQVPVNNVIIELGDTSGKVKNYIRTIETWVRAKTVVLYMIYDRPRYYLMSLAESKGQHVSYSDADARMVCVMSSLFGIPLTSFTAFDHSVFSGYIKDAPLRHSSTKSALTYAQLCWFINPLFTPRPDIVGGEQ